MTESTQTLPRRSSLWSHASDVPPLSHALLVVIVGAVIFALSVDGEITRFNDDAVYYLLGKALASGEGYVNAWSPTPTPATHFPPGYPVIVAAVLWVTSAPIAVKFASGFFYLATLVMSLVLFRRFGLDGRIALLASLFAASNPSLALYAHAIMSEMPFTFVSLVSLYAMTRIGGSRPVYRDGWWWAATLLIVCAVYLRTIGIALAAGFIIVLLARRQWVGAFVTVATIILLVLPWIVYSHVNGGVAYVSHGELSDEGGALIDGLLAYASNALSVSASYGGKTLLRTLFPGVVHVLPAGIPMIVVSVLLVLVLAYGLFRQPFYRIAVAGYVLATVGILLLWPAKFTADDLGIRFTVPLIPLFGALLFHGLYDLSRRLGQRLKQPLVIPPAFFGLLLLFGLVDLYFLNFRSAQDGHPFPGIDEYVSAARWAKENIPAGSIIACLNPSLFAANSDHLTVALPFTADLYNSERVVPECQTGPCQLDYLRRRAVDFVVIDETDNLIIVRRNEQFEAMRRTPYGMLPSFETCPACFEPVMRIDTSETVIYRFIPD